MKPRKRKKKINSQEVVGAVYFVVEGKSISCSKNYFAEDIVPV